MNAPHRWRWGLAFSGMAVALAGCSGRAVPGGGLLVEMDVDPSLRGPQLQRLTVDIGPIDGGAPYRDATVDVASTPAAATFFPTSVGIDSNGDPNAAVAIDLAVWNGAEPLDVEHYRILHVPTTRVAELPVEFGSSCAAPPLPDGEGAASPLSAWGCSWDAGIWTCDASKLPAPGVEVICPVLPIVDASIDASGDAAVASSPCAGEEAGEGPLLTVPCDAPCGSGFECVDGVCVLVPPSCADAGPGAGTDCGGFSGGDDCCASDEVAPGSFFWENALHEPDTMFPAAVNQFRLDRYEVTVGRFRQFVLTVSASGWTPQGNSGIHTYLNEGHGLSNGGSGTPVYETGWNVNWNTYLPQTKAGWDAELQGCTGDASDPDTTWSVEPDAANGYENEKRPINCVTWYEAYAFCIWDDAFLPSDVEWEYAAAGGNDARDFAWGTANPGLNANLAIYDCFYPPLPSGGNECVGSPNIAPVGSAPAGAGLWGQLDLTGNVGEWSLDYESVGIPSPCDDCAQTASGTQRGSRGGAWDSSAEQLYTNQYPASFPETPHGDVGFRCARAP